MIKVADMAMRNPTAGGMYNVPSAPPPGAPPAPPPGQPQPAGSMSKPAGTTGMQPSQMPAQTWRQTAADQLGKNMEGGQQQQGGGQQAK